MNSEMSFALRDSGKLSSMSNTVRCRKCRTCLHSTTYSIFSMKWSLIIRSTALTICLSLHGLQFPRPPRILGWCLRGSWGRSRLDVDKMQTIKWQTYYINCKIQHKLKHVLAYTFNVNRLWFIPQIVVTVFPGNYILKRKPSYHWETRATQKHARNCSNSTCLQRCRWQYWSIFIRLAVVASEICEILRNSLKIQTYRVQGHPRSSILVSKESPYVTSY